MMNIINQTTFNYQSNCCSCDKNVSNGDAIYCPSCKCTTCTSCAEGGKSGILGGLFRVAAAATTVGLSEVGRKVYRNATMKCRNCGNSSNLLRR